MAYYKTQIKNVRAGYAVDNFGKKLRFIGNYPCQAGDYVWTDGRVIFGNLSYKSQPAIFNKVVKSGVPILAYDKDWEDDDTSISYYDKSKEMRGYFDSRGKFINFGVAQNWLYLDSQYRFVNNSKKGFFGPLFEERQEKPEDIEVTGGNGVFGITRYKGSDGFLYMAVDSIDGYVEYHLQKKIEDFKQSSSDNETIELLFLKLQKSESVSVPVKWFAVFRTEVSTESTMSLPSSNHYTFSQSKEVAQEISLTQAGIWSCQAKIKTEPVSHSVKIAETKTKIFSIDSDGKRETLYESVSSGPEEFFDGYIPVEELVEEPIDEVRTGYGPAPMSYDNFAINYIGGYFTGTVTIEWKWIGITENTITGTIYRVKTVKEPVADMTSFSETVYKIKYPVQDDLYIEADNLDSPLKLYDSTGGMILNFSTSGDKFLADLTGFHNFAAIRLNQDVALLTMHDINPETQETEEYLKGRFWKIENGKAIKLNDLCHNFRFEKMKDIKKSKRV